MGLGLSFPAPAGLPEPRVQQRRISSAPHPSLKGRLDPRDPPALLLRKLPVGPPASLVLSTSSSPQLASCLLSVPPFPHPLSLSLPLSVPLNFRFPLSFPLPLSEGREKLGVGLGGLRLGMASNLGLVSCYTVVSPKAPRHTLHLGLFPQNTTMCTRGRVGQNCVFLCYSPKYNPSPEVLLPLISDLLFSFHFANGETEAQRDRCTCSVDLLLP